MAFNHKHILGIEQMSPEDIALILDTAESFKEVSLRPIKKVPTLRGKTIINVFFEASTRTRTSFEIAGKRLSADTVNISASTSAVVKGETLEDTARNLEAMKPDIIVMRHSCSGAPHYLAERCDFSVINAGDGAHEHPSQALLDILTMRQHKGQIEGLTVAIIGDITHSRVARSNVYALHKLGANVRLCGPGTMLPPGIERLGARVFHRIEDAIHGADVVMMLRIQQERQGKTMLPSLREYAMFFGLNPERMKLAKPDAIVMHPGPMNRGVEIASSVADGNQNVILHQVENGVAVRMALLYLVSGGEKLEDSAQ
ncbi:MAG: aspartate carbamoyltransferase catalytic subunit [Syntrophotalea acetylenica]|jgi:aspartate carbamoyltransferase catalytic subunit|uniref:Aspartate carbamoyltransferase n=1 Tax=Syntrophotalea acetylenica TaxID=29542 RepID=A0A1L3GIU2_SYNAC|nr:aspartate carbamoyltransferase catalytic subunit [Syntrophotalea acetylenica]APG25853.1 aspartate carbamoyltransferase [Syntrophotalea acetylenica]APG43924.1 aspartate carbamoyltransferase [Syntrophotalea acetylenica]MDD4456937.1 aspartate carbamoyltransferase catalytic subunit [Syntrophotalea acetylenica]MDY0262968.1 aspartate carbamoyltransferase catalytic subunit [Syntrophotalea acetylenica]